MAGLFAVDSGYLAPIAPLESLAQERARWEGEIKQQWPAGCHTLTEQDMQGIPGAELQPGSRRCLPRLIILGQFKAGSTALFDTLAQAFSSPLCSSPHFCHD